MLSIEYARKLLTQADIFFGCDDDEDDPKWKQMINLNDTFFWGCADCEYVEDEELPRLAELYDQYGDCGVVYWVAVEKRGGMVPEFVNVKRQIEFVTQEEAIRKEEPNPSKRAYLKRKYAIGESE